MSKPRSGAGCLEDCQPAFVRFGRTGDGAVCGTAHPVLDDGTAQLPDGHFYTLGTALQLVRYG